jgi:hypothetical protein
MTGGLISSSFATIQSPIGLAVGPDHNLYVGSDNLAGGVGAGIVRFAINGPVGTPLGTFVNHVGDNELNNPQGLGLSGGNLYAADATAGNIFVYSSTGTHLQTLSAPSLWLSAPIGLHFNSSGTMYVADVNQGNVLSYSGGNFAQVNSQFGVFTAARDVVAGADGNLYVLDASSTGGIFRLNPADGSTEKIIDYGSTFFQPSNLAVGPDGKLYVSGQDLFSAKGEVLQYGLDGTGGNVFADTGFGTSPGFMVFSTPEPSALALAGLAAAAFVVIRLRQPKLKKVLKSL